MVQFYYKVPKRPCKMEPVFVEYDCVFGWLAVVSVCGFCGSMAISNGLLGVFSLLFVFVFSMLWVAGSGSFLLWTQNKKGYRAQKCLVSIQDNGDTRIEDSLVTPERFLAWGIDPQHFYKAVVEALDAEEPGKRHQEKMLREGEAALKSIQERVSKRWAIYD